MEDKRIAQAGLEYHSGFNNYFNSEALPDSLPQDQNSPQKPAFGLYTEQLNGSAFTQPRKTNLKTWLYKINPSVKQTDFVALKKKPASFMSAPIQNTCPPNQFRWDKFSMPNTPIDFIDSFITMAANGGVSGLTGNAIHIYRATQSMDRYFYNADGDFLIIPQEGRLLIRTELGELSLEPLEIAVIPRGSKFQIKLLDKTAYGYVNENYGASFQLPELGPIGSNALANPRHFLAPVAKFEDLDGQFELICKFEGEFWKTELSHSPFDVVAWHGTYVPYKYDLRQFNTIGSISFDHPDPSIFTVLTSPTNTPGMANLDLVIFPPRWLVAENTFRPPWYHRNIMSEYMGLIQGEYDAKIGGGFLPGGSSVHNRMTAHGPDAESCEAAMNATLKPDYVGKDSMAFMLESCMAWRLTPHALEAKEKQKSYVADSWGKIKKFFSKIN